MKRIQNPQNCQSKRKKLEERKSSKANNNRNHLIKLLLHKPLQPKLQLPRPQRRKLKLNPLPRNLQLPFHKLHQHLHRPNLKKNLKKFKMPKKSNLSNLYQSKNQTIPQRLSLKGKKLTRFPRKFWLKSSKKPQHSLMIPKTTNSLKSTVKRTTT